jgi:ABC-type dipeptide/oligopeptide/nickel transport system permease subunit
MLAIDRDYVLNAWWLTAFSAGVITATVLAVNTLGRELIRRSEGRA